MTVIVSKPAVNLREELASLRNQGGYEEQQFYFDNLVTNGGFDADTDWTKGTNATISGGTLSYAGGSGNTDTLQGGGDYDTGKVYKVTFDISNWSSGSVRVYSGSSSAGVSTYNSVGTHTYTFVVQADSATLIVDVTSTFVGDIDNVSIFEADANDDVVHRMPKGWVPKDVYEDGLLQREGSAHDYEVVYDGFDYYVKPTVAPSATTQTCVIGVRK